MVGAFKLDQMHAFKLKISKNFQFSRPLYWGLPFLITPGWRKGKMQKVVSHPSTNRAKHCLTSVTGRELVLPSGYGLCLDEKTKTGREEMQSWVSHISGFLKRIRVSVPGASKLDHYQQVEPILFLNFSKCFIFILEDLFLLPQRANSEKREILPTPEKDEKGGFGCLWHSNWTKWSNLGKKFTKIFQKL